MLRVTDKRINSTQATQWIFNNVVIYSNLSVFSALPSVAGRRYYFFRLPCYENKLYELIRSGIIGRSVLTTVSGGSGTFGFQK